MVILYTFILHGKEYVNYRIILHFSERRLQFCKAVVHIKERRG
ncbi:hypothetical protein EMIT019CA3_10394 [Bacillus pseudomycoides]